MWPVPRPMISPWQLYAICSASLRSEDRRYRLGELRDGVLEAARRYTNGALDGLRPKVGAPARLCRPRVPKLCGSPLLRPNTRCR